MNPFLQQFDALDQQRNDTVALLHGLRQQIGRWRFGFGLHSPKYLN